MCCGSNFFSYSFYLNLQCQSSLKLKRLFHFHAVIRSNLCCEICNFVFVMEISLKVLEKSWKRFEMLSMKMGGNAEAICLSLSPPASNNAIPGL